MDGAHRAELLFTPAIDRDIHALFLRQIADSEPAALHVVIADQAGFHLPEADARIPANLRLLRLPPYSPELNPEERFGGLLKAQVANRLDPSLRRLEDHLCAAARRADGRWFACGWREKPRARRQDPTRLRALPPRLPVKSQASLSDCARLRPLPVRAGSYRSR